MRDPQIPAWRNGFDPQITQISQINRTKAYHNIATRRVPGSGLVLIGDTEISRLNMVKGLSFREIGKRHHDEC